MPASLGHLSVAHETVIPTEGLYRFLRFFHEFVHLDRHSRHGLRHVSFELGELSVKVYTRVSCTLRGERRLANGQFR